MFNRIKREEKTSPIDPVIDQLISEMAGYDGYSDEYAKMVYNLKILIEAKAVEPRPEKMNVNTIATVAANLAGIAMILISERANVITSKGLGFVIKPKL